MKAIQIKNNIINIDNVRKISYEQNIPSRSLIDDRNLFNIEFTYSNGDKENYEMTYEKFQQYTKYLNTFVKVPEECLHFV